ncbi:hypothetical protein AN958_04863 [Leucoagaricus sp. SymC.cos]|nr:hypothetical protein AN958_04863 [Leucoagaricus sp. SymC.cos]
MDANLPTPQALPPYYVLVSHSSVNNAAPGAPSSNFSHPIIQYQYQDDSAIPLLPQHPDEHVLVLDYDPSSQKTPTVKSVSRNLVVTGLKVDEAPGAILTDGKNTHMFVIETTSDDHAQNSPVTERKSPHVVLAEFKHRNAILRRALTYPEGLPSLEEIEEPVSAPQPDGVQSPNAIHS